MFDKDFYPTPRNVAAKMLSGIKYSDKLILEPSAGKGDIVDFILSGISEYYTNERNRQIENIHCVEKNPDLQNIMRGKGYKVVDSDFLTYKPEVNFDLIVMNPPFSEGAKHLLRAIEISKGCEIVCLLNAETLRNPCTEERRLLANMLKDAGAGIEFMDAAFTEAERRTSVDVALVKIPERNRSKRFEFKGNTYGEKRYTFSDIQANQLASTDVFESMVHRYNKVKDIMHQVFTLIGEAQFYAGGLIDPGAIRNDLQDVLKNNTSLERAFDSFVGSLRRQSWGNVYSQTKISGLVTTKVRDDLNTAQQQYGQMNFTVENLDTLMKTLYLSLGSIRTDCIVNAFDMLTKFHDDNKVFVEGWKTNDAWMIKPKCVMPYGVNAGWNRGEPEIAWANQDKIEDIEKALCFVTNKNFDDIKGNCFRNIWNGLRSERKAQWGLWHTTEFFDFKLFKKGTIHLKFKDESVCTRFNVEACQGKNWLPADYGRSTTQNKK